MARDYEDVDYEAVLRWLDTFEDEGQGVMRVVMDAFEMAHGREPELHEVMMNLAILMEDLEED